MTAERRRDPRVELFAQIEIPHEGQVEIVQTRDVSVGGAFLLLSRDQCPWIKVGATVEIVLVELPLIFADEHTDEPENRDALVSARGKVVRRSLTGDAPGAGISFTDMDPVHRDRLRRIIERVLSARP